MTVMFVKRHRRYGTGSNPSTPGRKASSLQRYRWGTLDKYEECKSGAAPCLQEPPRLVRALSQALQE